MGQHELEDNMSTRTDGGSLIKPTGVGADSRHHVGRREKWICDAALRDESVRRTLTHEPEAGWMDSPDIKWQSCCVFADNLVQDQNCTSTRSSQLVTWCSPGRVTPGDSDWQQKQKTVSVIQDQLTSTWIWTKRPEMLIVPVLQMYIVTSQWHH